VPEQDRRLVHDALLFPTTLISVQPDYALLYRLFPLAADRTRIDFAILFHPACTGPFDDVIEFWQQTNDEDRAICERQQLGIASGAWTRTPFDRLIVIRGEDLQLRALHDVCRHRGAALLDGEQGRIARFTCPYHGWSYDLGGRLRDAGDAFPTFEKSAHGLVERHVEVREGLAFVSLEEARVTLPPFVERAGLARLRAQHHARWEVSANWKLLIENFQESHHFPRVHPGLESHTPFERSSSITEDWLGGAMPLVDRAETVSRDGLRHGRPFIVPEQDRRLVHDALLFPTTLISVQPDYALLYRLFPLAADRTRIDFAILFHPTCTGPIEDVIEFWQQTNDEDRAICERQQVGIASGAWSPSCYTQSEDGMHAFDQLVARFYLS
jgi:Rieske 2Fe-2S family protein